jgi:hypothetical protein
METTAQTCARLLTALEDFGEREAVLVREGDFAMVAELQARATPLVEYLGKHGPAVADGAFLARMRAFLLRRKESDEWLAAQIAQTRNELQQIRASEVRAARIKPVYSAPMPPVSRLSGVG